jgi:hypothetical protein
VAALPVPTAPAEARSPWRALRRLRDLAGNVASAVATPHKASVRRLADMPLSVLGTGGIDFSAFHVNHGVGFLVLGVSLWVIEHLIADADDSVSP